MKPRVVKDEHELGAFASSFFSFLGKKNTFLPKQELTHCKNNLIMNDFHFNNFQVFSYV